MASFLSRKRQELLVFGYARVNSPLNIPFVLVSVCFDFYKLMNVFTWKIKGQQLQKFLSKRDTIEVESDSFKIDGITFQYVLASTRLYRYRRHGKKSVQLRLREVSEKSIVSTTKVYYKFHCQETDQLVIGVSERNYNYFDRMPLICEKPTELNYSLYADILKINYCNDTEYKPIKLEYNKPDIFIQKNVECKWEISNELLQEFKSLQWNDDKKYYCPTMNNDNWELYVNPKFKKTGDRGFKLCLELFKMPLNIKYIDIMVKIYTFHNDSKLEQETVIEQMGENINYSWICEFNKRFNYVTDLSFLVKIDIINVYVFESGNSYRSRYEKLGDKSKWSEYNVM